MAQLTPSELVQCAGLLASRGTWGLDSIVDAVHALGWRGTLCGPLTFRGTSFVAVHQPEVVVGPPGSPWLIGCLVPGADPRVAMGEASLLAGYARRAILLRGPIDVLDVKLQTALLDQGAVVEDDDMLSVLATPGEVVPSPLQQDAAWQTDRRWLEFCRAIRLAPLLRQVL